MINPDITNVVQEYVYNQSCGAVTTPVNGSWLQAYCNYLGITTPVFGSWVIALAYYHSITAPVNGTWWWALAELPCPGPPTGLVWETATNLWENETTLWNA